MADFRTFRHMPTVKVAMTTFPHSIEIEAPADEAWATMLDHKIRHLPVTDDGKLVGIVTERDLRLVLRPGVKPGEATLRHVVETDAFVVDDDTPLDVVANELAERQIGSALVTRHGKLVGILTTTDVCRLLAQALEAHFAPDRRPLDEHGDEPDESA
jgi:acetoin utilization protein AcuB